MPKLSVCMATRNGARFIRRQIASILPQLRAGDELIISDDSSTDDTVAVIKSFHDPRILLLENNRFFSPIFNLENALSHATGEVIVLSDQDDVWLDNKIEVILKQFQDKRGAIRLVALDGCAVDEEERPTDPSLFEKINAGPGVLKNIVNNTYMGCCLAFSSELLRVALPFPRRIPMHDMWLGLLAELYGEVAFVPEKTILYRKHAGSVTEFRIRFMPLLQMKRRWFLAWHLAQRRLMCRGR